MGQNPFPTNTPCGPRSLSVGSMGENVQARGISCSGMRVECDPVPRRPVVSQSSATTARSAGTQPQRMTAAPRSPVAPSTSARPPIHVALDEPVLKAQDPPNLARSPSSLSVPTPALEDALLVGRSRRPRPISAPADREHGLSVRSARRG